MPDTIRPFANGAQFIDWQNNNCCRCTKYSFQIDPATGKTRAPLNDEQVCPIELALLEAGWGNGTVMPDIAKRMGFTDPLKYCWPCGEAESLTTGDPREGEAGR